MVQVVSHVHRGVATSALAILAIQNGKALVEGGLRARLGRGQKFEGLRAQNALIVQGNAIGAINSSQNLRQTSNSGRLLCTTHLSF